MDTVTILLAITLVILVIIAIKLFTSGNKNAQLQNEIDKLHKQIREEGKDNREELLKTLSIFERNLRDQMVDVAELQNKNLQTSSGAQQKVVENLQTTIEGRLKSIQTDSNVRLEKMQGIVDEKLQSTLEKRLSESFKTVSERLEAVHKGLGEMQTLAIGVGDLKRVLTNVKTRGTYGEAQLENIITDLFTSEQYVKNAATVPGSNDRVEFALRMPGQKKEVLLPIDAKFPQEDYQRLLQAHEDANIVAIDEAQKALEQRILKEAKDIKTKYVAVPYTTDFAILFVPTEGLFAEILRNPGFLEKIRREYKVIIAGPTTLTAILNSLHMGFRTLAIEKRSAEVWTLLASIKGDFTKFGELLAKTKDKLLQASNTLDDAERKTRTIEKKLTNVQQLPSSTVAIVDEELQLPE
jgi:DNA recombination protein RmuC